MHKRVPCLRDAYLALFLLAPSAVFAQSEEEFHHSTLSAGAGLTTITGADAGKLDHDGTLHLNGGYFFNRRLGITGNFMFSGLGITSAEFIRPTLAQTVIFNPWSGYFRPALIPANQILGTVTNNSSAFGSGHIRNAVVDDFKAVTQGARDE